MEARWRGRERWFDATVVALRPRGRYDLIYEDGDEETSVPSTFVRALAGPAIGNVGAAAEPGETARPPPDAAAVAAEQAVLAFPPSTLPFATPPLASPSVGGLGGSALQALRDAKAMQDEGLISADDFAAMKARILSNL